ncbi:hypothetical protein DACRYDRAFT_100880 [Dacryopinax primogenitus]|uniref:Uncharacterized protein n=1 Tax=Dacryopinax primogenitus (strain DJM 731) TaxID=1858805 RepID=M5G322_DACPD|nr:uncharacterized protein DACRYDRAFT_100880 [Dacryopinax primogenitus]EJU00242.1 hypothetical protein DACRYDRAFT_100880 [Dacryopinax primogenitus]
MNNLESLKKFFFSANQTNRDVELLPTTAPTATTTALGGSSLPDVGEGTSSASTSTPFCSLWSGARKCQAKGKEPLLPTTSSTPTVYHASAMASSLLDSLTGHVAALSTLAANELTAMDGGPSIRGGTGRCCGQKSGNAAVRAGRHRELVSLPAEAEEGGSGSNMRVSNGEPGHVEQPYWGLLPPGVKRVKEAQAHIGRRAATNFVDIIYGEISAFGMGGWDVVSSTMVWGWRVFPWIGGVFSRLYQRGFDLRLLSSAVTGSIIMVVVLVVCIAIEIVHRGASFLWFYRVMVVAVVVFVVIMAKVADVAVSKLLIGVLKVVPEFLKWGGVL